MKFLGKFQGIFLGTRISRKLQGLFLGTSAVYSREESDCYVCAGMCDVQLSKFLSEIFSRELLIKFPKIPISGDGKVLTSKCNIYENAPDTIGLLIIQKRRKATCIFENC